MFLDGFSVLQPFAATVGDLVVSGGLSFDILVGRPKCASSEADLDVFTFGG